MVKKGFTPAEPEESFFKTRKVCFLQSSLDQLNLQVFFREG